MRFLLRLGKKTAWDGAWFGEKSECCKSKNLTAQFYRYLNKKRR